VIIPIVDIKLDPEVQLRAGLNHERVQMFVDLYTEGIGVPPITVVGLDNLLADGHHRLAARVQMGGLDIEATRREGDRAEAIALACIENDGGSMPLSRSERNQAIKYLLLHGWTQQKVADRLGTVSQKTISDITNSLRLRGQSPSEPTSRGGKGRTSRTIEPLPVEIAAELNDTQLARLALLPEADIEPVARAAVEAGLNEPQLRGAIRDIKAGTPIEQAVRRHTPTPLNRPPSTPIDAAKSVIRQLRDVFGQEITWNGRNVALRDVIVALAQGNGDSSLGTYPIEVAQELEKLSDEAGRLASQIYLHNQLALSEGEA
jgi:ParB-like chromosome segregation protein Spo0J